jgi:NAD dependent epimerase/dehydratase family enzyme
LSFEIYNPKNNVHNQDGNHDDNKVRITIFFFELTDNDGQNFLAGIVLTWENSALHVEKITTVMYFQIPSILQTKSKIDKIIKKTE